MQTMDLTVKESEVLRDVLRHKLDEADVEMFRTDTHDYKQMLKHRREIIQSILTKLSSLPAEAAHHG